MWLTAASAVLGGGGGDTSPTLATTGDVSVGLGGEFRGSTKNNPWPMTVVVLGGAALLTFYLLKK
jgi:hypothetical protein